MIRWMSQGWRRLVGYFMAGLLAVLPIVITMAIVGWVTKFLTDVLGPGTFAGRLLAAVGLRLGSQGLLAYLIGLALVLVVLLGLGVLVKMGATQVLHNLVDALLKRVPIVGSLYASLRQLVDMFDPPEGTQLKAMSVVFCYFGSPGGAGVLALMASPEVVTIEARDYHVVIIPTAPVPFGGGLVFFPAELVRPVPMSVDSFISIYVSMGVSTPELMKLTTRPPA